MLVEATQSIVGPQPCIAHESPAAGSFAQVPHSEPGATAQNADTHCAAYEHAAPFAAVPLGGRQAIGGSTPDSSASQASFAIAPAHASSWLGEFAVFGAARAWVHASFSRVSQVAMSGQRRCMSADEQVISWVHSSCARLVQA